MLSSYDAVNRTGTLDHRMLDPEIEWRPPPTAPTAGVYKGRAEAVRELEAWTEPFVNFRWEPREISERGNPRGDWTWMIAGRMSGRGRGSGVETEIDEFHVWTIRRGRAVKLEMYLDRDEALRAAGIESAPHQ